MEIVKVIVYGKSGCAKCESAKDKCVRMGYPVTFDYLSRYIDYHPEWRDDSSVDVTAAYALYSTNHQNVPLVQIGENIILDYAGAMKYLKQWKKDHAELF